MALQIQRITLPFTGGQDEAQDDAVSTNGLPELRNGWYDKDRAILQRPGFRELWHTAALNNPRALVSAGTSLGVVADDNIYPSTAVAAADAPLSVQRTPTRSLEHVDRGIMYDGGSVSSMDVGYISSGGVDFMVVAWCAQRDYDSSGTLVPTVHWRVIDMATGTALVDVQEAANTQQPRVVVSGPLVCVLSLKGTANPFTLIASQIGFNSGVPNVVHTGATLSADVTLPALNPVAFDAEPGTLSIGGDGLFVAYWVDSTTHMRIASYSCSLSGLGSVGTYNDTTLVSASRGISLTYHASSGTTRLILGYDSGKIKIYNWALTTLVTSATLISTVTAGLNISCVDSGGGTLTMVVGEWNVTAVASGGPLLCAWATYLVGVGTTSSTYVVSNTLLLSRLGMLGTDVCFVGAPYSAFATGYRSAALLRLDNAYPMHVAPIATASFDESALVEDVHEYRLPALSQGPRGLLVPSIGIEEQDQATSAATDPLIYRGRVAELVTQTTPTANAQLQGVAYLPGSMPRAFDGTYEGESSWLGAPEAPRLTVSVAGANTGTWSYKAVYELVDAKGVVHVSPPSPGASTGAITSKRRDVIVDVRQYVQWFPNVTNSFIRVKVYRTVSLGSTYYLAYSFQLTNNTVSGSFSDGLSDADLVGGELLYTTAALDSEPPPPLKCIFAHRNRLVGVGAADPYVVYFTKELVDGNTAPQWSTVLSFRVDDAGGPLTGGASLGDKMVLFKRSSVLLVSGYGPDANGGGPFAIPERLVDGCGASDPAAIVATSTGIVFLHQLPAKAEAYRLGSDLSLTRMPEAPPLSASHKTVRHIPCLRQSWFMDGSSEVTVYDHVWNRWYVWEHAQDGSVLDVVEVAGVVYALVTTSGEALTTHLCTVTPGVYGDDVDGTTYAVTRTIVTPWVRAADVAGMQRVRKVFTLCEPVDGGFWSISADVLMERDELSLHDPVSPVSHHTWSQTTGADTLRMNLQARPRSQRCSGVRVSYSTTQLETSGGLKLLAMSYDVGVLPGRGKVVGGKRGITS